MKSTTSLKVGVIVSLVTLGWIFHNQIGEALGELGQFVRDVLEGIVRGLVCLLGEEFSCRILNNRLIPGIISGLPVIVIGFVGFLLVLFVGHWLHTQAENKDARKASREAAEQAAERHAAGFQRLKTCPKCQSINSSVHKYEIVPYTTSTTKTRITRRYNADGDYIGHEELDIEVPLTLDGHAFFMKCNCCGHTWKIYNPGGEYIGKLRKECVK